MNNRVRWLLVLVPALVVGAIEIVSDQLLDEAFPFPLDTLVVVAVTLVLGGIFGALAFRRIDTLTGALRRRNQELEARETSARALHRVSVAIASLTDVERVLDAIVTHTRSSSGWTPSCSSLPVPMVAWPVARRARSRARWSRRPLPPARIRPMRPR